MVTIRGVRGLRGRLRGLWVCSVRGRFTTHLGCSDRGRGGSCLGCFRLGGGGGSFGCGRSGFLLRRGSFLFSSLFGLFSLDLALLGLLSFSGLLVSRLWGLRRDKRGREGWEWGSWCEGVRRDRGKGGERKVDMWREVYLLGVFRLLRFRLLCRLGSLFLTIKEGCDSSYSNDNKCRGCKCFFPYKYHGGIP